MLDKLVAFLDNQGYSYQFKNNKFYGLPFEVNEMISQEGVKDFMSAIVPEIRPRDYQIDGFMVSEVQQKTHSLTNGIG